MTFSSLFVSYTEIHETLWCVVDWISSLRTDVHSRDIKSIFLDSSPGRFGQRRFDDWQLNIQYYRNGITSALEREQGGRARYPTGSLRVDGPPAHLTHSLTHTPLPRSGLLHISLYSVLVGIATILVSHFVPSTTTQYKFFHSPEPQTSCFVRLLSIKHAPRHRRTTNSVRSTTVPSSSTLRNLRVKYIPRNLSILTSPGKTFDDGSSV